MRFSIILALTLLLSLSANAQQSKNFLKFLDDICADTRLGRAYGSPVETPFLEFNSMSPLPAEGSYAISSDFNFINYLIGNNLTRDAVVRLSSPSYAESDTLHYLRGWVAYSSKDLSRAVTEFSLVSEDSPFFDKSLFYNIVSNAHMQRFERSIELLDRYSGGPYNELASVQRAGLALLSNDSQMYLKSTENFSHTHYALAESEDMLERIYNDRYSAKSIKKPLTAALLSTIVPGAGKFYAGDRSGGAASLLGVGSMGILTASNWSKHGADDWHTIFFGALTAALHIGNIYGSWLSVSIENNKLINAQNTAILYSIHIPLRSIFD